MGAHLDALEEQLAVTGGPWILGGTFSLADVSWLVIFERLAQVDALHLFTGEEKRPGCSAYWQRLQARHASPPDQAHGSDHDCRHGGDARALGAARRPGLRRGRAAGAC